MWARSFTEAAVVRFSCNQFEVKPLFPALVLITLWRNLVVCVMLTLMCCNLFCVCSGTRERNERNSQSWCSNITTFLLSFSANQPCYLRILYDFPSSRNGWDAVFFMIWWAIMVSDYRFSHELTLRVLNVILCDIPFTLRISASPMGGLQAWSWTVEPHIPQQSQCMMATSCNKVTSYHELLILSWLPTISLNLALYINHGGVSSKLYNLDALSDSCSYPIICGAICWLEIVSQPCQ